jgi:hypothetical protein
LKETRKKRKQALNNSFKSKFKSQNSKNPFSRV